VQLIHGPSDRHLWAQSFDRELRGILALQSEVARAIAGEIRVAVTPAEAERLVTTRRVNPEAYEAYLKGRYHSYSRTPDGRAKAINYFEQALEKEPNYAAAHAGLADVYAWQGVSAKDPKIQRAKDAVLKALALDDTLGEAHATLGLIRLWYDWDWSAAQIHLKRAVELNPSSAVAHHSYGVYFMAMRRLEEALHETTRARELDPLSARFHLGKGSALYYLGDYDRALEEWAAALDVSPHSPDAHAFLGLAYLQKGMYEEAVASARNAEKVSAVTPDDLALAGYIYGRAGRRGDALRVLNELRESSKRESGPINSKVAWVYAGLGQKDQAFHWLEKAYQEREYGLAMLKLIPPYDPLRDDPRFQALLRRMNFPE